MSTTAELINIVSRWLNYLLAIPMILFGMIGGILTILIFIRQRIFWRNTTITYLAASALLTIIHLPTIYLSITMAGGFSIYTFMINGAHCRLFNYFLYVTTVSAISFPCWAAFDQYASTNREARFRNRWNSMKVVRYAIVGTIIFWLIFYLPVIILSDISIYGCSITDNTYRRINNYVFTPLVFTAIPVILIFIFMRGIIQNLHTTNLVNRHDRLERQIRRMLIPQIIILAISGFPFGLESVYLEYTSMIQKNDLRLAIENIIFQILRLFYHINFVCSFYIYVYMSNEIRQALKRLFNRCFPNNIVVPIRISNNAILLRTFNSTNPDRTA